MGMSSLQIVGESWAGSFCQWARASEMTQQTGAHSFGTSSTHPFPWVLGCLNNFMGEAGNGRGKIVDFISHSWVWGCQTESISEAVAA